MYCTEAKLNGEIPHTSVYMDIGWLSPCSFEKELTFKENTPLFLLFIDEVYLMESPFLAIKYTQAILLHRMMSFLYFLCSEH
jgi:hypothetical protein